jgi:hypothetical protein
MYLVSAKYLEDYKVEIEFDSGEQKIVDLETSLTGEVFEPLKNKDYFKTVKLDPFLRTITWDNGADFAPEYLYNK